MQKKQAVVAAKELKGKVMAQVNKSKAAAEQELAKVKKRLENTYATVERYARKNPEKAAMVSAGIGVALGAAVALLLGGKKKK